VRVAIVFDMEAASQIQGFEELYPSYEAYWRRGRQKLTSDVAAAARGLLAGDASRVLVLNHHGAGENEWPNLITEELPAGVEVATDLSTLELRDHVDAMFQVGCHARGGSQSFSSHTILPGLRLRLDGELLSESHWWALNGAVPVLGIVGSAALGSTLGSLADVPFLTVQGGESRARPLPLFASEAASAAAIEAFARSSMERATAQRPLTPRAFVLEASIQNGDDAAPALLAAGWTRTSGTEFSLGAVAWHDDPVGQAIDAAIEAAWSPYASLFRDLDPRDEASALAYPRSAFAADNAVLRAWHEDRTPEWFTPELATRWEGLTIGQARPSGSSASV
jgi:D-amino peptidase